MFLPDIVLILNRPYLPDLTKFSFSNVYAFYDGRILFSTAESKQISNFYVNTKQSIQKIAQAVSRLDSLNSDYFVIVQGDGDSFRRLYAEKQFAHYAFVNGISAHKLYAESSPYIRQCE